MQITQLTELRLSLINAGIPVNGIIDSDPISIDYKDGATAEQRIQGNEIAASFIPVPTPEWRELMVDFTTPGNALYEGVLAKTQLTGLPYHRFQNLQQFILNAPTNPDLQKTENLAIAIRALAAALADAGNPMDPAQIEAWNEKRANYNFPPECDLPV